MYMLNHSCVELNQLICSEDCAKIISAADQAGAKEVKVFGSSTRKTNQPPNDVDIVVEAQSDESAENIAKQLSESFPLSRIQRLSDYDSNYPLQSNIDKVSNGSMFHFLIESNTSPCTNSLIRKAAIINGKTIWKRKVSTDSA